MVGRFLHVQVKPPNTALQNSNNTGSILRLCAVLAFGNFTQLQHKPPPSPPPSPPPHPDAPLRVTATPAVGWGAALAIALSLLLVFSLCAGLGVRTLERRRLARSLAVRERRKASDVEKAAAVEAAKEPGQVYREDLLAMALQVEWRRRWEIAHAAPPSRAPVAELIRGPDTGMENNLVEQHFWW